MKKSVFLIACTFSIPLFVTAHGGTNDENNIIRMTENGFEPKELTVTEGDEVLFINNNGDVARWPASNFHPTHTLYPEFDPKISIKPGESWTFKFDKPGTWRMHDHLIPHFTGTIVVLEDPGKIATTTEGPILENLGLWAKIKAFFLKLFRGSKASTVSGFKSLDEKDKYAWLEDIANKETPEAAWRYVKAAYDTPEGVVGNPHDMAHLVGQLIYKKYGLEKLSICDPIFAFGCYHGLMEVAFDKDRGYEDNYKKDLLVAQDGCKAVGDMSSPSYWSCIHGMGHGIATFRNHSLDKSLKDCGTLDEGVRTYCHDGVFMEFSISAPPDFYKKADPIYPCDAVGENYKVACARSQVQVMRLRLGFDTTEIAKTCKETGNQNIIFHCVDALGYFIAQTSASDAQDIIAGCREIADGPSQEQCLAAAAGELVFQNSADWKDKVKEVCQGSDKCAERVEQVKKSYGRQ